MDRRLELQNELERIMSQFVSEERDTVYFQPPTGYMLKYPCIVYSLDRIDTKFANNLPYGTVKSYQITIMDRDPDSRIPDEVGKLAMCNFNRSFTSDNLHHYVYKIYY